MEIAFVDPLLELITQLLKTYTNFRNNELYKKPGDKMLLYNDVYDLKRLNNCFTLVPSGNPLNISGEITMKIFR